MPLENTGRRASPNARFVPVHHEQHQELDTSVRLGPPSGKPGQLVAATDCCPTSRWRWVFRTLRIDARRCGPAITPCLDQRVVATRPKLREHGCPRGSWFFLFDPPRARTARRIFFARRLRNSAFALHDARDVRPRRPGETHLRQNSASFPRSVWSSAPGAHPLVGERSRIWHGSCLCGVHPITTPSPGE